MAMVLRAGRKDLELGGHIASFASAATLYDVGFNHFWHAPTEKHGGDLIYIQGHSSPGVYARAFLEGRLTEAQLDIFRQEVDGKGISSYPHPWLMPDFWQFPTVSMGLGPIQAIYQARFMRYLEDRGLADTERRKVWAFMGDGEMDEPESMGAIGMAAREGLDNLVFVVNCNLQRLDGPVRGNGKIIQELETNFRGAGWNVIKVIWGSYWDPLLARDKDGILLKRMEEAVDGEYQKFKSRDGAYVREHFFGKYPELQAMVANMSDEDIWRLNRGGHDPHKIYAAYHAAVNHTRPAHGRSSPRRSRATAWARSARARTSPTSRRRCRWRCSSSSATASRSRSRDDRLADLPVLQAGRELAGDELHARRRARGSAAPSRSAGAARSASTPRSSRRSSRSSRPPARAARTPPRWPSCACSPRS